MLNLTVTSALLLGAIEIVDCCGGEVLRERYWLQGGMAMLATIPSRAEIADVIIGVHLPL